MNRNEKLLENLTHFWLQVDEINESFQRAINKRLKTISNDLISSIQASRGQITPRNLPILASNGLLRELQGLVQDINGSLLQAILRASRAFPKFVNNTNVKNEALDLSLFDPFGLTDLGEDSNTFTIAADVLGISEDEARLLFVELLLFGLSLSEVWQIFLIKQRDKLRQRLAQIVSQIPDNGDQVIPQTLFRDVEREVSSSILGDSLNSVGRNVGAIVSSVLFSGINSIVKKIIENNQGIFSGEYLWVGILDSVICKRCASLHNKRFRFNEGPLPQLHPHCRCFVMPILRDAGPVSAGTFNDWLRQQKKSTQDSILGKRGAELFRQGKVRFKDFIQFRNKVNPRERTLDSIERIANK